MNNLSETDFKAEVELLRETVDILTDCGLFHEAREKMIVFVTTHFAIVGKESFEIVGISQVLKTFGSFTHRVVAESRDNNNRFILIFNDKVSLYYKAGDNLTTRYCKIYFRTHEDALMFKMQN